MKTFIFLFFFLNGVCINYLNGCLPRPWIMTTTTTTSTTTRTTTTTKTQAQVLYPNPACPAQDYDFYCESCDDVKPACN
jgi:hypothetical protein